MRQFGFKLLFAIVIIFSGTNIYAYDFQIGDLCYTILSTSDKTVSVESSSELLEGDIIIPSVVTFNDVDFKVTRIADKGFAKCHGITSFTIPNTINYIGELGFGWCWYLNTIILDNPSSNFYVGSYAFDYDWRAFKTVRIINCNEKDIINNGVGILSGLPVHDLYINDTYVSDYKVADGVEILNTCFENCTSIESLELPNSVKSIVANACYNCTSLKSITLSSNLQSIDVNAFEGCARLDQIIAKGTQPAKINESSFANGAYMFAKVCIPKGSLSKYKNAIGWKNFINFVEIEFDQQDEPEILKCDKPIISYTNGILKFNCNTEGAEFVTSISCEDVKKHYSNEIALKASYSIEVYATAPGYENSEITTATLCWIDEMPKTEGITNEVLGVRGKAIFIQAREGTIYVSGVGNGTNVRVFNTAGINIGNSKTFGDYSEINTCLRKGEIAIVQIGEQSVKVLMQ